MYLLGKLSVQFELKFPEPIHKVNLIIKTGFLIFFTILGGWEGFAPFEIVKKIQESEKVVSFYFKPQNGNQMPPYKAGQYLSFNFKKGTIEGVTDHDVKRNWSISCGENQETFRISIKKEDKGLVSTHMHDNVKIGDVLEVQY